MTAEARLILDPPADGLWNMALDEALLELAGESGIPTLRLYRWQPATLSLGYFQPYQDRESHPPSTTCPVVRRSSGGGAILHDRELTYSFTATIDDRAWARGSYTFGAFTGEAEVAEDLVFYGRCFADD